MMKKTLQALVIAALVATPSVAFAKDDKRVCELPEHSDQERHTHKRPKADVLGIVAGIILGPEIGRSYQYHGSRVYSERTCFEYRTLDTYGRVVSRYVCR